MEIPNFLFLFFLTPLPSLRAVKYDLVFGFQSDIRKWCGRLGWAPKLAQYGTVQYSTVKIVQSSLLTIRNVTAEIKLI